MKTYDDNAVRAILEKAAEFEKARAEGLTLEELEAIGAEAGIAPEFVRAAAQAQASSALVPVSDAPGRVERLLARRLSDDDVDWVVQRAQDRFGAVGSVSEVGDRTTWQSHGGGNRYVEVVITRGDGTTAITVDEPRAPLWFNAMGLGSLGAIATAALLGTLVGAAWIPVALAPLAGGALLARHVQAKRRAEHRALVAELPDA